MRLNLRSTSKILICEQDILQGKDATLTDRLRVSFGIIICAEFKFKFVSKTKNHSKKKKNRKKKPKNRLFPVSLNQLISTLREVEKGKAHHDYMALIWLHLTIPSIKRVFRNPT